MNALTLVGHLLRDGFSFPIFRDEDGRCWSYDDPSEPAGTLCPVITEGADR